MKNEMMMSQSAFSRSSKMKRLRLISVAAVLLAVCLAFVGGAAGEDAVAKIGDSEYSTLKDAVDAANSYSLNQEVVITLLQDVTLDEKLTISNNVYINGNGKNITRADSYTGTLFTVNAGATLTLDGKLTIDGGNEWKFNQDLYDKDLKAMIQIPKEEAGKYITPETGAPVATAYMIILTKGTSENARGGTVNLLDVTIKNHYSINSGIVSAAQYTTVVLKGAKITHCAATQASGVVVNADGAGIIVVMEEDTLISGNHVGSNHGIFKIYSGTVFTMNGGTVTETTGWNSNGVVVGLYGGTFIMNGGEITYSSSVRGTNNGRNAAIYLHSNSVMEMKDGTINNNAGHSRGGIDSSKTTSQLTITGGSVEDNISLAGNGTPDVGGTVGTWSITGGTFTQDVSQWCAKGYAPSYNLEAGTWGVSVEDEDKPAFQMTITNTNDEIIKFKKTFTLTESVEWGKDTIESGQTTKLDVLVDWKQDSNVIITYPIDLSVHEMKTLILDRGIFVVGGTVEGEGEEESEILKFGNLTILDGTYKGGDNGIVLVKHGSLVIEGGFFTNTSTSTPLLRIADDATDASITITGGTFNNFNPTDFVPEEYTVIETETNVWTVKKIHSITVTSTEGGTASASPETAVEGTEITLTITPDEGYRVGSFVMSCDVEISSDGKFTMPASDISIEVVFERIPTSYGGGGDGGALSFPRVTENGGSVDFGSSKVVKSLMLPEGSSGSVVLKVDTIEGWTNILETEYTFDISVQTMGEGMAYILFEIPLRTLENLGITPADVCAYHFVDGEWVMLKTTYEVKEGTVFYEAETDSFSPFKLVFEEGAAVPKEAETEPTVPPTEEPDVPDEPETLPPIDEPVDEPETPAPLLAVLAGLGAAVVLRRK